MGPRTHQMLGETIEQPYSDVLAHTPEVCKSAHLYNRYLASRESNYHDSRAHGQERHGPSHD
jgi:hypothetical protein